MCSIIDTDRAEDDMGLLRWLRTSILKNEAYALDSRVELKNTKMLKKLDGSEASMIPLITSRASDLVEDSLSDPFFFQEFSVGRGIADIYIVSKNPNSLALRKKSKVPAITDKTQNEIVNLLWQNNGMLFGEINELLRSKRLTSIDKNIQSLLDQKILYVDNEKVYVQESTKANIIEYSVAIEAKVSDWKKGLKQALRYKNFADKSYLALYESHISTARNSLHVFETLNVGLIGVSDEGIKIYYEPKANIKDPVKTQLASERVYSLIDNSQNSFVVRNNFVASTTA